MDFAYYRSRLNTETTGRYDVSPLFRDPDVLRNLISDAIRPFREETIDAVAALDALGFILGAGVALELNKPLLLLRKRGKLPLSDEKLLREEFVDYTGTKKGLEIERQALTAGQKVLIVDEWIETGSQVKAAINLLVACGADVVGIACLSADRNEQTETLFTAYNLKPISEVVE